MILILPNILLGSIYNSRTNHQPIGLSCTTALECLLCLISPPHPWMILPVQPELSLAIPRPCLTTRWYPISWSIFERPQKIIVLLWWCSVKHSKQHHCLVVYLPLRKICLFVTWDSENSHNYMENYGKLSWIRIPNHPDQSNSPGFSFLPWGCHHLTGRETSQGHGPRWLAADEGTVADQVGLDVKSSQGETPWKNHHFLGEHENKNH